MPPLTCTSTTMQGPHCVGGSISNGSDNEVIAHDNRSLESGATSPVDIILVDKTHSTNIVHHNHVSLNWENSIPTFATLPHTPSIDYHSHHHKHLAKARSRTSQSSLLPNSTVILTQIGFATFQYFHTPMFSTSDGYEPYGPYHSAQSSSPSHSLSPLSSLSLHNHRLHYLLLALTMSTSSPQQSHPIRWADPRYLWAPLVHCSHVLTTAARVSACWYPKAGVLAGPSQAGTTLNISSIDCTVP